MAIVFPQTTNFTLEAGMSLTVTGNGSVKRTIGNAVRRGKVGGGTQYFGPYLKDALIELTPASGTGGLEYSLSSQPLITTNATGGLVFTAPSGAQGVLLTPAQAAAVSGAGNSLLLPFQLADAYAIGSTPPDYEIDFTNLLTLPTGVTATTPSLSARGAYISGAAQVVSIALATVLPALTATAWTVEVEYELDSTYTTDGGRTVFEFGGTTNNRHVVQIAQGVGHQNAGYGNVSTLPSLSVKTGSSLVTGLPRAGRVLSACSGTAASIWFGPIRMFTPTDLQAVSGTLSVNIGATKSLNNDYLGGWAKKARIWASLVPFARQQARSPIYTDDIISWGDSLTQGSGASPAYYCYPSELSKKLGRNVYNRGIAGETSTQIRDRFLAETQRLRTGITVIWSGRNNPVAATVVADVQAMVSRLDTGSRYLVMNTINRSDGTENVGSSAYNAIISVNSALQAAFPANYLAVRELLVATSGGTNDAPAPAVTVDGLHLTNTYYGVVSDFVAAAVQSRGW